MMMSDVEPVTSSAPPTNEELIAINPMYKHLIANDPDAYYPWTSNLDEIAIEEEQIPIPCGYTAALYAMETATDQQMLDYQALLDTHGVHDGRRHQGLHQHAHELGWNTGQRSFRVRLEGGYTSM